MKSFLQKNWLAVLAVVLALIIVGIVVYYAYFKGKGAVSTLSSNTDPNNPLTDNQKVEVNDLATRLQSDIYDKFSTRDNDLYRKLVTESDQILAAVYNQYRTVTGADLIGDMSNEYYSHCATCDADTADNADKIIQRLKVIFKIV